MIKIYSARWVLPISSPVIEDGAVAVAQDRIVAVGHAPRLKARFANASVLDFGHAALLPGLVNAHSHLELTVMRGFLEREENAFFAWLRKLTVARMAMTSEDLYVSAMCGAIEAARAGVTCVGDASAVASAAMKALNEIGLRGIVYQESFGPDPAAAKENVRKLQAQLDELRGSESALVRAGVSPHAVYTVSAPQLEMISRLAQDENFPLMMHAAESCAEELFMLAGTGPFAEGLRGRNIDWQSPRISTVQYLSRLGVLETKPLLAHCITVDRPDIHTIKSSDARIAHCPKSNAKLGHGRAPFARFIEAGVKVGLGSDSVASNNTCDILEEARFATLLARISGHDGQISNDVNSRARLDTFQGGEAAPLLSSRDALFAATLGGARALGLDDRVGALAEGKQADLVVVALDKAHQQPTQDPSEALVLSSSGQDVLMTMVGGQEVYRNDLVSHVGEAGYSTRLREIRARLDSIDPE